MTETWSLLGKARLQELIGENVLSRLETLLPALKKELTPDVIYTSDGLSTIFNSFSGASQLEKPSFRAELFNSLPPERMAELCQAIGASVEGFDWLHQVDVLNAAWKNSKLAETIVDKLGIARDFLPQQESLPPDNIVIEQSGKPYKPLKDFQVPVYTAAMQHFAVPLARFVIQMPTGSGKTRTSMEVIAQVLNDQPDGSVVIWLAHSEELCEQAYDCFNEVWSHVSRRPLRLIRSWGTGATLPFEFTESAFVVGGFPKLYARLQKSPASFTALASRVVLLIVDEAHKIIAPTYNEVTKSLIGNQTRVMGLTATPGRSIVNEEENAQLAQFFFNEIIGLEGSQLGVLEMLRQKGVLAQTEYIPLNTSRSYKLLPSEKLHFARFFDFPPGLLSRLADDDIRNLEIIRRLQDECERGGQILFFGCNIDHSKFICALLTFLGIKAVHLDGTTNRARRQSLIADFRSGRVQVLCNYALLSTGFDAPKTDAIFIARPTGSIVLYSQMIGRGLRGPAIGGTEKCRVIDVIDNIADFSDADKVYHYFEGYFSPSKMV